MAKFTEDELNDLPTTRTKAPTKTTDLEEEAPVSTASTKTSSSDEDDENLDVEFGDQKLMSREGIQRIRASDGKKVRYALLNFLPAKAAKSHFLEFPDKKGTFRCSPDSYCCSKLGKDGQVHIVALALQYTNADAKTGKYAAGTPIEWEIGYVDLSRSNFRQISGLAPEDSTVSDIDIVMSKKENGIGYENTLVATEAKWKKSPELVKEVEEAVQKYLVDNGSKLIAKLGKKMTTQDWKTLLSTQQASSGKEASLDDIEEMS